MALVGVLRSSSARSRSINGTERSERGRAAIRALQQAVERFADATATKRFPSSRCASTIQIVRPLESIAAKHPQLQPAFLTLSPMIDFCPSIVRFRRCIEMKCFCSGDIGRLLLMGRVE